MVADGTRLDEARTQASDLLDQIDRSCNRRRADADLVRANQAAGRWVRVDPVLASVVQSAVRVAKNTSGLVDPVLISAMGGSASAHLPVLRRPGSLAGPEPGRPGPRVPSPPLTGAWDNLEIDLDGGLKIPAGAQLDLGAMHRAFAADAIARTVSECAGTSLVVCIGGDIAVGNLPGEQHRWQLTVHEQPDDPKRYPAVGVVLAEGALSTSSILSRRWQVKQRQVSSETQRQTAGMVRDWDPEGRQQARTGSASRPDQPSARHPNARPPRADQPGPARTPQAAAPGEPADSRSGLSMDPIWRTASVCAATCVDAQAASTAAIALGEQAPAWLWQRSLAARLITPAGRVLRIAGWPI